MSVRDDGPFSIGSDVWPGTSKLVEEIGELGQVLGKLIGTGGRVEHWAGPDLDLRLMEELPDVQAAIDFFIQANTDFFDGEDQRAMGERRAKKVALFWKWQREQALVS